MKKLKREEVSDTMKFNLKKLQKILDADVESLYCEPNKYWDFKFQTGKGYLYIDRGAKILGIAHMDTVADKVTKDYVPTKMTKIGADDNYIESIRLDDRLGVFFLMDVLPYYGLKYDILLTTDEEIGMSTARNFTTTKKYNWIFELDRRDYGTAVLYKFDSKEIRNALNSLDYKIETGSFSDICDLDNLGCAGINFGTGYKYEHTNSCMTRTSWMSVVVNMFTDFFATYKNNKFNYDKPAYSYASRWSKYSGYSRNYGWDDDYAETSTTGVSLSELATNYPKTPEIMKDSNGNNLRIPLSAQGKIVGVGDKVDADTGEILDVEFRKTDDKSIIIYRNNAHEIVKQEVRDIAGELVSVTEDSLKLDKLPKSFYHDLEATGFDYYDADARQFINVEVEHMSPTMFILNYFDEEDMPIYTEIIENLDAWVAPHYSDIIGEADEDEGLAELLLADKACDDGFIDDNGTANLLKDDDRIKNPKSYLHSEDFIDAVEGQNWE